MPANSPPPSEADLASIHFADEVKSKVDSGEWSDTTLKTDQKILARITDGIYRHAASALRELICNSYDADASSVIIDTDFPRFKQIKVSDDGNGMSVDTLSNMLHHIGGSAKRNFKYVGLGVNDPVDVTLSPVKKRKLIGKMGIGLFSVAQLTRDFSIITKQKGSAHYTIADIQLHNFSEEEMQELEKRGEGFETGSVHVYSRKAEDLNVQGTDIVLRNIKKSAVDQLRTVDIWQQILNDDDNTFVGQDAKPDFHIGAVDHDDPDVLISEPSLPWSHDASPPNKFKGLHSSIALLESHHRHPSLNRNLDNYLRMLWTLGLSLPVDYIERHPYDLSLSDSAQLYEIQNNEKHAKKIVDVDTGKTVRDILALESWNQNDKFEVIIDGVEILRPLQPLERSNTTSKFDQSIFFYGAANPKFGTSDHHQTGGNLKFEAFIRYSPRIVPKEHRGVLIRINGATGVLFDPDFMRWQLAEHLLKQQITVEINIIEGFEAALNIDRESFNIAHPHYQIVMRWLHHALKQAVYTIKSERAAALAASRAVTAQSRSANYDSLVLESVPHKPEDDFTPVSVTVGDDNKPENENFTYHIPQETFESAFRGKKSASGKQNTAKRTQLKDQVKAIIALLDAFDLLDDMSEVDQVRLFEGIVRILSFEE